MIDVAPGLILQHAHTGPPGRLGAWASDRGLAFEVGSSPESLPADPAEYGWVASLGSALSVSAREPEWVAAEVAFLGRAVQADVPVLGLCWGGQALSVALGGTVGPASIVEKGWLSVVSVDPAIPAGPWLHYHTEFFSVPDGAIELARSPAGPAAFRIGPHLGLQFHPEADAEMARVWAAKDPDQTDRSRAELAAAGERWDEPAGALAEQLFDGWWAGVSARAARPRASGLRR